MTIHEHAAVVILWATASTVAISYAALRIEPQQAPPAEKRQCFVAIATNDETAVRYFMPCDTVPARFVMARSKSQACPTEGFVKPCKKIQDRITPDLQAKNDYSMIIEKKRSEVEAAKKKGKKK